MTPQEAIEILLNRQSILVKKYSLEKDTEVRKCMDYEYQAINTAFNALKKQIPQKLDYEGDGYDDSGDLIYDTAICRNCSREFEVDYDEHSNYCPNCGQALDWDNENV